MEDKPWAILALQSAVAISLMAIRPAALTASESDALARQLVAEHARKIQPLEIDAARRFWDANVSGTPRAYRLKEEAENLLDAALADREWFERLKRASDAPPTDKVLARQIRLAYLQAAPKQGDPELLKEITARGNGIEMRFNAFRARVGDEQLTASDVRKVLRESTDSGRRQAVWEASKRLGYELEVELLAVVKLRNRLARQLGFADYHRMQLELNEQTPDDVPRLFDEVDDLTREPFQAVKRQIDARLAKQSDVAVDELRPWHYHDPFFRDPPSIDAANFDAVYAGADVLDLCRRFYSGIGLPIDGVLSRSDLYEKSGKHPSSFCIDIDRAGDVRVLANVVATDQWMGTMLHELGHAVYSSKNMPAELPYLLCCESHLLTTEGVATMFERLSKNAEWLKQMGEEVDDPAAYRAATLAMRRNRLLVFSRFCQVILRFERELYRNPDQNLNRLWWDLVEKYQELKRPEGRDLPDYACQLHIATAPAYFHNYLLGELFACQLHHTICREVLDGVDPRTACYVGHREVGDFLRKRVFAPGRSLSWNELTKFATGEELNVRAFADDIAE